MTNLANRIVNNPSKVITNRSWVELCAELNKLENKYTLSASYYSNTIDYTIESGSLITITDLYRSQSWFQIYLGCEKGESKRSEFFGSKPINELAIKIHKKVIELAKVNQLKTIMKEERKARDQSTLEVINEAFKTFDTLVVTISRDNPERHTIDIGKVRCTSKDGKRFNIEKLDMIFDINQIKELYQLVSLSNESPLDELILANLGLALLSNSALVRARAEKLAKNISKE